MSGKFQGIRCWYCGEAADSRDHAIPKGRRDLKKQRKQVVKANGCNLLPACSRCNGLKGMLTPEEFRTDIKRCTGMTFYFSVRDSKLAKIAHVLKPWQWKFYGERGTTDCTIPQPSRSGKFRYRWKMKQQRNTGEQAVRIEECAKRGPFGEVQGGLINQP